MEILASLKFALKRPKILLKITFLVSSEIFSSKFPLSHVYSKLKVLHNAKCYRVPTTTKRIKNSLNPVWNEEFFLRVAPNLSKIYIEVFDANKIARDSFLGYVSLDLAQLEIETEINPVDEPTIKMYSLRPRGTGRVAWKGEIFLHIAYLPSTIDPCIYKVQQLPSIYSRLSQSEPDDEENQTTKSIQSLNISNLDLTDNTSQLGANINSSHEGSREMDEETLELYQNSGWVVKIDKIGRKYYVNHQLRCTQWDSPSLNEKPLPEGWQQCRDNNGRIYYVDHKRKRTTWHRPVKWALSNSTRMTPSNSSPDVENDSQRLNSMPPLMRVEEEGTSRDDMSEQMSAEDNISQAHRNFLKRRAVTDRDVNEEKSLMATSETLDVNRTNDDGQDTSTDDSLMNFSGDDGKPKNSFTFDKENLGPDFPEWQVAFTQDGRQFFINHEKKITTWIDPRGEASDKVDDKESILRKDAKSRTQLALGPLPNGWEERIHDSGRVFYINHNKKSTQWEDPRLMNLSKSQITFSRNYKQKYDYFIKKLRVSQENSTKLEIRINRKKIFEDSFRQITAIPNTDYLKHRLWIEFDGDRGLDFGGIQREWFFLLSHEIFNPYYGLFEYSAADNYTLQINPHSGVFNADHLKYFNFIGRIVGMAVYHGKLIDGFFIRPFYKMMLGKKITLKDMEVVDFEYYRSLKYILEMDDVSSLELTFSVDEDQLGQTKHVDLIKNGNQIKVTDSNKKEYIESIISWRFVRRVEKQMKAFLDGFNDVVSLESIQLFDPNELELVMCGLQDINVRDWKQNTLYKGGYYPNHVVIVNFWKVVFTFTNELRSRLLQFTTGTSRVPMNGFAELWGATTSQKFTIEKWGTKNQLPRAHTCFNRLDLPPYETFEELRTSLIIAIEYAEGFEGVD